MTKLNSGTNQERFHPNLASALEKLRSRLPAEAVTRADRIAHIRSQHVSNKQDKLLESAVEGMTESQAAFMHSGNAASEAHKQRGLFVIGESGTGKSTAIEQLFQKHAAFQRYENEFGETVYPATSLEAPNPMTMKLLAKRGLESIGYPINKDRQENQMWDLFHYQLKERSVLWVHVDEMQHAIRSNTHAGIQSTADVVKSLLQMPDWPLNAIFSGVPSLAQFLQHGDKQLQNRCKVVRFDPLRPGQDTKRLQVVMGGVIVEHASMTAEDSVLTAPFVNRVMHATNHALGTAIQFTREVIFRALRNNRENVEADDFVKAYAEFTGCTPSANIFRADNWKEIIPGNALKDYLQKSEKEWRRAREDHKRWRS